MESKKYVYTYNKKCEVCKKDFQTQRYATKICSQECVKTRLSQKKKYTDNQVSLAIALRKEGMIIPEIVKQTGIKKPSLQKIFQENNIKLSEEDKKAATSRRWDGYDPLVDGKKQCSKCGQFKPLEDFHKNNNRLTGTVSSCKECSNKFYEENKEQIIERVTRYKEDNPEKVRETYENYYEKNKQSYIDNATRWSSENPEKRKEITKNYAERNQNHKNARTASYRARKKQAEPKWLTPAQKEEIKQIYINRPEGYHVDHDIPIGGENVCGLHVPWNLVYLPEYQNESKGNRYVDTNSTVGICHQYKVKMETLNEDINNGMPIGCSIDELDFFNEEFSEEHSKFIKKYEWLGTVGYAPKWIFTARVGGILGGVVIITEPNAYTNKKEGSNLEAQITRGASASWAPKNLASKLIMFACRWMIKNTTKRLFFGYSDHAAGEIGTIYQACNFRFLGNHFGATTQYELENNKMVNSRYFNKTSTFKKYAKELGIEWKKEWMNGKNWMDRKLFPTEIFDILLKKGKVHKESCKQSTQAPKGKYVLILGHNKADKRNLESLYLPVFGKSVPYPKRV